MLVKYHVSLSTRVLIVTSRPLVADARGKLLLETCHLQKVLQKGVHVYLFFVQSRQCALTRAKISNTATLIPLQGYSPSPSSQRMVSCTEVAFSLW